MFKTMCICTFCCTDICWTIRSNHYGEITNNSYTAHKFLYVESFFIKNNRQQWGGRKCPPGGASAPHVHGVVLPVIVVVVRGLAAAIFLSGRQAAAAAVGAASPPEQRGGATYKNNPIYVQDSNAVNDGVHSRQGGRTLEELGNAGKTDAFNV
jgi:hypothetical protein